MRWFVTKSDEVIILLKRTTLLLEGPWSMDGGNREHPSTTTSASPAAADGDTSLSQFLLSDFPGATLFNSLFTPFLPTTNTSIIAISLFSSIFLLSPPPLSRPIQLPTRLLAQDHLHLHLLATQGDPLFPIRASDPLGLLVVTGVATRVEEVATQDRAISRAQEAEGAGGTQL